MSNNTVKIEKDGYVITVDRDKTREYYRRDDLHRCDCLACRNFYAYADSFPNEVDSFFDSLGLDLAAPSEVYAYEDITDGKKELPYGGWWHLCGEISRKDGDNTEDMRADFELSDNFRVTVTNKGVCIPTDFPSPVITVEIDAVVPVTVRD